MCLHDMVLKMAMDKEREREKGKGLVVVGFLKLRKKESSKHLIHVSDVHKMVALGIIRDDDDHRRRSYVTTWRDGNGG